MRLEPRPPRLSTGTAAALCSYARSFAHMALRLTGADVAGRMLLPGRRRTVLQSLVPPALAATRCPGYAPTRQQYWAAVDVAVRLGGGGRGRGSGGVEGGARRDAGEEVERREGGREGEREGGGRRVRHARSGPVLLYTSPSPRDRG
eukprot:382259-Rhodomonas_salina.3